MGTKVADRVNENYYKQIADKITQLLDKIHNSSLSDKRWVWELMQNAKDVPNKFERVSIKIELWEDKLKFCHNGDHFTDADITGLIQQVSSKDSANEGEQKQTGKFGSGFITTHLLSNIVDVEGVVLNPNTGKFQQFNLRLDRSARKSEDMIQSIKDNLEWVKGLDVEDFDTFPLAKGYETREEDAFNTSFTYHLNTDSMHSAKIGLDDLVNTLPITMVSLPKIKSVIVEDYVNGNKQHYVCNSEFLLKEGDREIIKSCITINGDNKYFLTYKMLNDGEPYVALSIETRIGDDGRYELVAREKSQPVLFRDFPLIGSEEFYFPYMLNGFDFEPTENRSGILLNRDEEKPKKNRTIIENAIGAVQQFNEWLISQRAKNTYLMASSREPKPEESWDENYAKPWIKAQMESWHEALLKQKLLETSEGYVELSQIRIPDYGSKEVNRRFYEFLNDFKVNGYLPLRTQQEEWASAVSWAKGVKLPIRDLFEDLQRIGNISSLSERLGKDKRDTYEWLNNLYKFIIEQGDMELLKTYPVVPNQYENFCLLDNLVTDSSQRIPERLKEITIEILERDLHDELLAEEIDDSVLTIKSYTLDNLIQEMTNKIASAIRRKIAISSDEWLLISKCVYGIIAVYSNNEGDKDKRENMYSFVSHFFENIPERQYISDLPQALWSEADKFVVTFVPYLIENNAKTLEELGNNMLCCPKAHNDNECISWLNDYKKIASMFGMIIPTSLNIYPNQKGELRKLEQLHFDKGIPSALIELNITASECDWREKLLDNRIAGYEMHDPLGTADIYEEVRKFFTSDKISESKKMNIAREAITLNPATPSNEQSGNSVVHDFLKKLDKDLPDSRTIEDASGFSWEIFVAFTLKDVCKRIADAGSIGKLSELIGENEDATVDFVDKVICYTANCYGKRYQKFVTEDHELWINQKGGFRKLSDISRDENVDEEIKDLANNPIVGANYRESLLRKNMKCEYFLPPEKKTGTDNLLTEINKKLTEYVEQKRSLQDPDFADLVIKLSSIVKQHPNYGTSLAYFVAHKDRLIVGSIGDDETLNFIGSIVSSAEKMAMMQRLNKLPLEHLDKISKGEYIFVTAEELAKLYNDIDPKELPVNKLYEDDSISTEDQEEYSEEAKKVVLEKLETEGFDTSNKQVNYSLVNGVLKDGKEFPLVVKSYKSANYQFRLNPNEWTQLMRSMNSMLLVHRGNGVVDKVSLSQLFRKQDKMSLQFSLEALGSNETIIQENITKFADILRYFKGCHFDFSNLASTRYESMRGYQLDQDNPNAFIDLRPDDKNLLD